MKESLEEFKVGDEVRIVTPTAATRKRHVAQVAEAMAAHRVHWTMEKFRELSPFGSAGLPSESPVDTDRMQKILRRYAIPIPSSTSATINKVSDEGLYRVHVRLEPYHRNVWCHRKWICKA